MLVEERGGYSHTVNSYTYILSMIVVGSILLASCGDGGGKIAAPTAFLPSPEPDATRLPSQAPFAPLPPLLPCHIELVEAEKAEPIVSPTPETIRLQVLDRPYRIVPNDIVLIRNRSYRLILQAHNDWLQFSVGILSHDLLIPPNGEAETIVQPKVLGIYAISNVRHLPETDLASTITVVPEGASVSTWHPYCAELSVLAPPPDATVSAPFVIQGSVVEPSVGDLRVTRIEAWSDGRKVGETSREHFISQDSYEDFLLTIPFLPPGTHSLLLQAYLQNGNLAVTASLPLSILAEPASTTPSQGYRGSIDIPDENRLLSLPVTVQGWAVIPGSRNGTGVGSVEVWNGPRETGSFLTEAIYGTYRPDVVQVLGDPRFASSGFYARIPNLSAGPANLHIYIRDRESGDYVSPHLFQSPLVRSFSLAEGKVTDAAWPVALAAAPDGRLFFAELLTGNIRILQGDKILPEPFATLRDVSNYWESGLMGLALHPNFPQEPYVYAMYVVENPETGLPSGQRVVRFRDVNNAGQDYTVMLDNLPSTTTNRHNGGRIAIGPDGNLYLSIGDIDIPSLAQDTTSPVGSILRISADGSIPDDNPISGSLVYASGLRNVFGLAFQPETGYLFATDNGPGGFDEVNKIKAGHNYGWPLHMGVTRSEGYTDPIAVYGTWPERPIGPTGATFSPERPDLLLFCAYHDFFLRAVRLSGPEFESAESTTVLSRNCALDVTYSADGWLYYSTVSAIFRARLDDLVRLQEADAK